MRGLGCYVHSRRLGDLKLWTRYSIQHILQELRFTGSVKNHELYDFVLNIFPSKRQTTPWLHELQVQTTRISVQSYWIPKKWVWEVSGVVAWGSKSWSEDLLPTMFAMYIDWILWIIFLPRAFEMHRSGVAIPFVASRWVMEARTSISSWCMDWASGMLCPVWLLRGLLYLQTHFIWFFESYEARAMSLLLSSGFFKRP